MIGDVSVNDRFEMLELAVVQQAQNVHLMEIKGTKFMISDNKKSCFIISHQNFKDQSRMRSGVAFVIGEHDKQRVENVL